MADYKTATNHQTGDRVIQIDGEWKPLSEFKTATNPETGEQAVNINGKWSRIPGVDLVKASEGGAFGERFKAGLSTTPAGRRSFIESQVGKGNVLELPDGQIMFRRAENETFRPFDDSGPDVGDVADLSGAALETVPGLLATAGANTPGGRLGTVVGTALRAGVADTGGNVLRQTASAALPGEDNATPRDRAESAVSAFALGAAGQGLADTVLTPGMEALNPKNAVISRPVQRQQEQPQAIKGRRLAAQTGIPQSIGEETGSRSILTMEAVARAHPLTADRVANVDAQKIATAHQRLRRQSEMLAQRTGQENSGLEIGRAFDGARSTAIELREATAKRDFAVIDSVAGTDPILPVNNYLAELDSLISGQEAVLANSPAVAGLRRLRDSITKRADSTNARRQRSARQVMPINEPARTIDVIGNEVRLSGAAFQNSLALLGKAASGSGDIIKDLSPSDQRRFAKRLFGALQRDLDDAAQLGDAGNEIVTALQTARDNYRVNSQHITDIAESGLGRIIGTKGMPAPEVIFQKVQRLPLSEYRQAVRFLDEADPEALATLKRSTLDDMLDRASVSGSRKRADGGAFSPAKFNSMMLDPKQAARLRTLYNRQEFVELKRVSKAMERINDQIVNGSNTAVLDMAFNFMRQMGGASLNLPGFAGAAARLMSVRTMSQAMADPAARQALIEISRAKTVTQKTAQAAATLAGIVAFDSLHDAEMRDREMLRTAGQRPGL